ncbi:MAG: hypothetical protein F4Y47_00260 [Acidobacteriia bacterium]|nr:hypothetical protein [Terriglobia bacterium]MYG04404.1 hypothetical protein [Terriglobia bacterium]MYK11269.1 hypothetical protein [Terriglobia bacterium]
MDTVERFRQAVREAVGKRPVAKVAVDAGLPRDAIRYVLKGRNPPLSRAAEIADALELDFAIGSSGQRSRPGTRRAVLNELDRTRSRVDAILQPDGPEGSD